MNHLLKLDEDVTLPGYFVDYREFKLTRVVSVSVTDDDGDVAFVN